MKAILQFDCTDSDDMLGFKQASRAHNYAMFVWDFYYDILNDLYNRDVFPEDLKHHVALLEHLRKQYLERLHDNDLRLDMIS